MKKQQILNAFREMRRLNGYASIWKYHPMGVARDIDQWLFTTLTEFERDLVDEIKEKMYQMPAFRTIEIEGKRLEVLTKYQVANLLNIYEHTPFSQLEKEKHT